MSHHFAIDRSANFNLRKIYWTILYKKHESFWTLQQQKVKDTWKHSPWIWIVKACDFKRRTVPRSWISLEHLMLKLNKDRESSKWPITRKWVRRAPHRYPLPEPKLKRRGPTQVEKWNSTCFNPKTYKTKQGHIPRRVVSKLATCMKNLGLSWTRCCLKVFACTRQLNMFPLFTCSTSSKHMLILVSPLKTAMSFHIDRYHLSREGVNRATWINVKCRTCGPSFLYLAAASTATSTSCPWIQGIMKPEGSSVAKGPWDQTPYNSACCPMITRWSKRV